MSEWWEPEEGYPLKDSAMVIEPEDDYEYRVWVCGVCQALTVTPTKHIEWHKEMES